MFLVALCNFHAFVFTQIDNESFYKITSIFEQEGVSVRDAKVVRVNEEYCIYSFYFDHMRTMKDEINQEGEPAIKEHLISRIDAIEKDRKRIRDLFPNMKKEEWHDNTN